MWAGPDLSSAEPPSPVPGPTVASLLGVRLPEATGRALIGGMLQTSSERAPAVMR